MLTMRTCSASATPSSRRRFATTRTWSRRFAAGRRRRGSGPSSLREAVGGRDVFLHLQTVDPAVAAIIRPPPAVRLIVRPMDVATQPAPFALDQDQSVR